MTAKEHNRLVGIFLMIHGGLQALIMGLISLIYGGIGLAILIGGKNQDKPVGVFFIVAIAMVVIFSSIFILPQVLGGWKMLKEKPNAKIWGIIGSIVSCMSFPLGTAAGVYGLWFLFGEEGKKFYDNQVSQNYLGGVNQVNDFQTQDFQQQREPHSWR
ncbi:MAG: hypothetical protein K1X72_01680 [Pyrinomonadaceae bacterium]|nr:hypothetical protein [Pyrinomonadaceae bacterium]